MTVSILDPAHPDIVCSLTMDSIDTTNGRIIDAAGNYDGDIYGAPTFPAGAYGNAINGSTSDYVSIPGLGTWFAGRSSFGISLWRNPKDGVGVQPSFCVSYSSHTSPYYLVLLQIQTSFQRYTIGGHDYRIEDNVPLSSEYHHFVINYDSGHVEIYRNKTLIYDYDVSTTLPDAATSNAMLGRIPALNSSLNAAALRDDQLRICSRPFTIDEISELYEEPYPFEARGLVSQDGSPISTQVRIYNAATGELVDIVNSDASGAYQKVLSSADPIYVMAVEPDGYRPLVHGPINPSLRNQ